MGLKVGKVLSKVADPEYLDQEHGLGDFQVEPAAGRLSAGPRPCCPWLLRAQFFSAMWDRNCLGLEIKQSTEYVYESEQPGIRDD